MTERQLLRSLHCVPQTDEGAAAAPFVSRMSNVRNSGTTCIPQKNLTKRFKNTETANFVKTNICVILKSFGHGCTYLGPRDGSPPGLQQCLGFPQGNAVWFHGCHQGELQSPILSGFCHTWECFRISLMSHLEYSQFFACLLVIFAAEIAASVFGFLNKDKIIDEIQKSYDEAFDAYQKNENQNETLIIYQTSLSCCGKTDMKSDEKFQKTCPENTENMKTCDEAIKNYFKDQFYIIGYVGIGIAGVMEAWGQTQPGTPGRTGWWLIHPPGNKGATALDLEGTSGEQQGGSSPLGLVTTARGRTEPQRAQETFTSSTPGKMEEDPSRDARSVSRCKSRASATPGSAARRTSSGTWSTSE
ncbi:CD9 protein, partial [Polypterus senegalus]